jgi:hypothetical protein
MKEFKESGLAKMKRWNFVDQATPSTPFRKFTTYFQTR